MKKKKRRDPNSLPVLTKKLDRIFSKWVRLSNQRADGTVECVTCGHAGDLASMQAGHWIPRQHRSTRWAEWNVWPQCFACNMYYGGRPQEYREFMVWKYGEATVQKFAKRRHEIKQWTREELKETIELYTKRVQELE